MDKQLSWVFTLRLKPGQLDAFKTMVSEIVPLTIITSLEGYDVAGAIVIATMMLALSFTLLYLLNRLQHWQGTKHKAGA